MEELNLEKMYPCFLFVFVFVLFLLFCPNLDICKVVNWADSTRLGRNERRGRFGKGRKEMERNWGKETVQSQKKAAPSKRKCKKRRQEMRKWRRNDRESVEKKRNKVGYKATRVACGCAGVVMNKAGYSATPVACKWAGAIFEIVWARAVRLWGQRAQKNRKSVTDGGTDGPTDWQSGV